MRYPWFRTSMSRLDKYPEQGYLVLLSEANQESGGICHIIDFNSSKGGRAATSTLKAGASIALTCPEVGQRVSQWLREVWEGAKCTRDLLPADPPLEVRVWTDCYAYFLRFVARCRTRVRSRVCICTSKP